MTVPALHLRPRDFHRLASFIHDTAGIKMPPAKRTMVEGRLRRRLRALNMGSFDEYCHYLFEQGGLSSEAVPLIDAVTTNKTEFFREPEHFRFLAEQALPALAARGAGPVRPLKIWSTASSTGAEPYTIAMVVDDFAQKVEGFRASILATDICTDVLETAVLAIYPEAMVEPVPMALRRRYLLRSRDRRRAEVRIVPALRRMTRFARLNLMDETYAVDRDFDIIFCRNQLIYFEKATQQLVLRRLCDHLRPGGFLFLGHSETLGGCDLPLRAVSTTVFVRI